MCRHKKVKALFLTLNGETLYHCPDCKHLLMPSWWDRLTPLRKKVLKLSFVNIILIAVLLSLLIK